MVDHIIRIGTRGSPLARKQAEVVQQVLQKVHGIEEQNFVVVPITTSGDRITDQPLIEFGGKGLFTKEIEQALLDNQIDIAVHSMKDVATRLPSGLTIACMLPREDPRDVLIAKSATTIKDLPPRTRVGTSSLRRACQIMHLRPDLKIVPLRGNVQTRINKIESGVADATLLALSGLKRLGKSQIGIPLSPETILPAVAQGALGIECCKDNTAMLELLTPINDHLTYLCVQAERAFLSALDGSCRTPIAGLAMLENDRCMFTGLVASLDGTFVHKQTIQVAESEIQNATKELGLKFYEKLQNYL
ncbi:MAG: hydroxymethylbilane synthase [Pseudomonadota bacterium]